MVIFILSIRPFPVSDHNTPIEYFTGSTNPRANLRARLRLCCPGVMFACAHIIEPSDIESSVRSRRSGFSRGGNALRGQFLALNGLKTDRSGQPPAHKASVSGVAPYGTSPDCQRCALAYYPCGSVIQGTLVARVASSSGRSALRSARVPPNPLRCAESALRGAAHKPRYRVGSRRLRRRHVRAAGFSWTSPAALQWKRLRRCYFRSLVCWVGFPNPGCSPDLGFLTYRGCNPGPLVLFLSPSPPDLGFLTYRG